jgi:hypothetical protein
MFIGWLKRNDYGPWARACTGRTLQECADRLRAAALAAGVPHRQTLVTGAASPRPIAKVISTRRRLSS